LKLLEKVVGVRANVWVGGETLWHTKVKFQTPIQRLLTAIKNIALKYHKHNGLFCVEQVN
jgi:hypothetical protein